MNFGPAVRRRAAAPRWRSAGRRPEVPLRQVAAKTRAPRIPTRVGTGASSMTAIPAPVPLDAPPEIQEPASPDVAMARVRAARHARLTGFPEFPVGQAGRWGQAGRRGGAGRSWRRGAAVRRRRRPRRARTRHPLGQGPGCRTAPRARRRTPAGRRLRASSRARTEGVCSSTPTRWRSAASVRALSSPRALSPLDLGLEQVEDVGAQRDDSGGERLLGATRRRIRRRRRPTMLAGDRSSR